MLTKKQYTDFLNVQNNNCMLVDCKQCCFARLNGLNCSFDKREIAKVKELILKGLSLEEIQKWPKEINETDIATL